MSQSAKTRGRWALIAILVSVMVPTLASAEGVHPTQPSTSRRVSTGGPGTTPLLSAPPLHPREGAPAWPPSPRPRAHARTEHPSSQRPTSSGGGFTGQPDWPAVAACESGGRWDTNSANGFWGGLQFLPHTWFAYGGGPFDGRGPFPYSASEQMAVARRVFADQGPSAWPACFAWK